MLKYVKLGSVVGVGLSAPASGAQPRQPVEKRRQSNLFWLKGPPIHAALEKLPPRS